MKKILYVLLLCGPFLHAQDSIKSTLALKKNEVRINLLSLISESKLNLTYERFLGSKISAGVTGSYANSKNVNDDFDQGFRNTIPKFEATPFVRYNFINSPNHYYFFEVFADANGGDFRETVRVFDGTNDFYEIQKTTYFDVALGGAAGYKLILKEKFVLEFMVGFGRNLINTAKSPDVISRVGLSFGYRF